MPPKGAIVKCVVTICQNKRAVLPYLFGKYCFPRMRAVFPGEMVLVHVFHNYDGDEASGLRSNSVLGRDNLEHVRDFIDRGMYPNASILQHEVVNREYLPLPSMALAATLAIVHGADLHLWLEDDAVVLDLDCHLWPTLLNKADVGLYRPTAHKGMVNSAYFLSRTDFDRRLLVKLCEYVADHRDYPESPQIEDLLFRCANGTVLLRSEDAMRHHVSPKFPTSLAEVKAWLTHRLKLLAEELDLLSLDFKDDH